MQRVFLIFTAIFIIACEQNAIVKTGNLEKKPLKFDFKTTRDADCGMIVDGLKFAAQVVAPDGKTWFFHDPGGVARFLEKKSFKTEAVIWFYTLDSKKWQRSEDVWFSLTDITPMEYGFGAYEKKQDGFINYNQMSLKMLRGENLTNPFIRKKLLGES